MPYSEYIVYVDESGDHGLTDIDQDYPMFVLAFCIFQKDTYASRCVPAVQELKFKHFGHDQVVLHERKIRKAIGDFAILINRDRRKEFMDDLNILVSEAEFTLIASAIKKERLQRQYSFPESPYDLALAFCLERLQYFLNDQGKAGKTLHVVFESRGKKEDKELELEFRRVCAGHSLANEVLQFEPVLVPKTVNSCGLQIADLVARPIGRHILNPSQTNRAYDIIQNKFRRSWNGRIRGYGLKVFP